MTFKFKAKTIRKALDISLDEIARKLSYKRIMLDMSEYTGVISDTEKHSLECDEIIETIGDMI